MQFSTPSPYGCYRKLGFSPLRTPIQFIPGEPNVIELSEGVVKFDMSREATQEMSASYYVDPQFTKIFISASGLVETLDPGFDFIRILANGTEILYAASTQDQETCGYEFKTEEVNYIFPGCNICGNFIYMESGLYDETCNDGVNWVVTLRLRK